MKRDEAIALRVKQLQGGNVDPAVLAQALHVIQATNTETPARAFNKKSAEKKAKACPCPVDDCPADQLVVVQALKPWALVTPESQPTNPESYVWPHPR